MSQFFEILMNHPATESLGWVLLHFVWQGFVVAVLLFVVLSGLRKATANTRYLTACAVLLITAMLPAITYSVLPGRVKGDHPELERAEAGLAARPHSAGNHVTTTSELPVLPNGGSIVQWPERAETERLQDNPRLSSIDGLPKDSVTGFGKLSRLLRPWLPFLTVAWLTGVTILSLRLLSSWLHVQRLQRNGVQAADVEYVHRLNQLASRLGIHRTVRLLESVIVEVPTVIGWLKPVILLPIASVNSLTVQQLEAILAHELAHIRRADYAVNLLQSLVETLLFYHPTVWWISSRIRQEREHCCDDLAATLSGDAVGYVVALVRMEELRCEPRGVAVAARGGDLLSRVRRLLAPSAPDGIAPRWVTGAAALLIVAAMIGVPVLTKSQAESAVAPETKSQKTDTRNTAKKSDQKVIADEKSKPQPTSDELDRITPSQIADRIEAAWKRYSSVEYIATVAETRNTMAHSPNAIPILVKRTSSVVYRSDGTRWFNDRKSISYNHGSTTTYPTHNTVSAFDGSLHQVLEHNVLKIAEEDAGAQLYSPAAFFWRAGISSDWLLSALRRPEAKLVGRIRMAETSCLNVAVEWKPEWSDRQRSFDIMICPEQGWLPRRVQVHDNGEMQAEWSIDEVGVTTSGLHYPVEFKLKRPETDGTPLTVVRISEFRERTDYSPQDFAIPVSPGIDVVDHRRGYAWNTDPWWDELAPWASESLYWPGPNLQPLSDLQSYSAPELAGKAAPPLVAGEWLTAPGDLSWDHTFRSVAVLYFFGGRLIEPTPGQLAALKNLYFKYADGGLEIIGIAAHSSTPEQTRQAIRELDLPFPVMMDAKASEAEITAGATGADWGANFVRFQLKMYTGTVVIDRAGNVVFVDPATTDLPDGMSHLEYIVRNELLKAIGTPDPPLLRQLKLNRISQALRGTLINSDEITIAVNDQTPLWLQNAQQAIVSSIPEAQKDFLKSHGMTMQEVLRELNDHSASIPEAVWYRLEDEWKTRAAAATGKGTISGQIRQHDDAQLTGVKATLVVEPVFRILNSNTPEGWRVSLDPSRVRKIESDETGTFTIDSLSKGTYSVTTVVPGKSRALRTVHLTSHETHAELNVDLSGGDTISGRVTDAGGNAIPNATVKAVKRFATSEAFFAGGHTTEYRPLQPATTNDKGEFYFESLFEGVYQFKVSAEGFETTTTEAFPAGYDALRVILKPAVPDQADI